MLRVWVILVISGVLLGSIACAGESPKSLSLAFLERIRRGMYEEAWAMEDETMRSLLSSEALKSLWEGMTKDLGNLLAFEVQREEEKNGCTVVSVLSRFERATLLAQVVVDERQRISGLYFVPYTASVYSPPPYAPERFREAQVTFGLPGFELPGTLTLPEGKGPFPCVLLVHGSGANDRDETVLACKPFRDLALGLVREGIATFRYDKRTYVHGAEIAQVLPSFTVEEEVIQDALAALEFLRKQKDVDTRRVFLLGHSLGGWLAPEIALRDGGVRGIVLCAAPARSLPELVPEQMEYLFSLDGTVDESEARQIEAVRKTVVALQERALRDDEAVPYLGGYARYYYSLMGLQPLRDVQRLSCPILVVQGGRDFQVREKDFLLWKEALSSHPQATFRWYPLLNHLLIPGEGPSTPGEYAQPGHVDETLVRDIALWIREH
jgi:hypothetical protein